MAEEEIIEGRVLAVREEAPAVAVSWTPTFAVAVDEAIERKRQKNRFFREVMDADLHYGVIPGTGSKPTLYKAGAEMLLANMGLNAEFSDAEPPIVDVTGDEHHGEPYIRYRRTCTIYRQSGPTEHERMIVGRAGGSCSSWEPKYRYRNEQRVCPQCGKTAIIVGKKEYGGGFVCFKKKDGCGAKFGDNDPAIVGQAVGKIANPDVAELENTILKMADKRALVAATLIATGCSDIFTQDVEDYARDDEPPATPPPPPAAPPSKARTATAAKAVEALVRRAHGLGIIETADFDQGIVALKNWAEAQGVAWSVSALTDALDRAETPANAPETASAPPAEAQAAPPTPAERAAAEIRATLATPSAADRRAHETPEERARRLNSRVHVLFAGLGIKDAAKRSETYSQFGYTEAGTPFARWSEIVAAGKEEAVIRFLESEIDAAKGVPAR